MRSSLSLIRRLFGGSPRLVGWSLVGSILQAAALVPVGLLIRRVFDSAIPEEDTGKLITLGAAILALYLAGTAFGLLNRYMMLGATKVAGRELRSDLLRRLYAFSRAYFDRAELGRLHSTIVQDSERVELMSIALLAIVLPSGIVSLALLVLLAMINPALLAVLLLVVPVLLLLARFLGREVKRRVKAFQHAFDTFSAGVLANLRSITLTKVHAAESHEIEAGRAQFSELSETGRRMAWLSQAYGLLQGGIAAAAVVIVLVFGGVAVARGDMSLGELLSFLAVLGLARGYLAGVLAAVPALIAGRESMARLQEILENDETEPYAGRQQIRFRGSMSLERVTFAYSEEPVLHDVSLALQPSEQVTIMGPNGSGKSTLLSLMVGLYRPQSGRLLADGVPFDELDIRHLRSMIGVVLQDPVILRGSIRDNIAYGRPDLPEQQVQAAAEAATAAEFILELPDAYDTEVGDEGERLSAGQRQRIAVARALVGRPPMLILDEPTTYLEENVARRLLKHLRDLEGEPTVVMISHDPAAAESADRVYELSRGRVNPAGRRSGPYSAVARPA